MAVVEKGGAAMTLAFPDQPKGSKRPLATIANVEALLKHKGVSARYNVIKKKVEIDFPECGEASDNRDNVNATRIISLAAEHQMSDKRVGEYVNVIADQNAFNPVADWIRSKPWDGKSRLLEFTETITVAPEFDGAFKAVLMTKWMLSATAAALVPNFKCRGVLTLQGEQGIGKTTWIRSLIPDQALYEAVIKVDHHMDGGSKDSVLSAISHWIVEFGELESSLRRDIDRLKGFLTSDSDRIRRPYDRLEAEYPRRTVFVATVNGTSFLNDPTGNTRWWALPVIGIDYNHGIDMQQLFAEMAVRLDKGSRWWLTKAEEDQLETYNQRHRVISAIAEKLADFIDVDAPATMKRVALSATEMLEVMGFQRPSNAQAKECAAALRELLGDHKRIRGINKWHVPLKQPDTDAYVNIAKRQAVDDEY